MAVRHDATPLRALWGKLSLSGGGRTGLRRAAWRKAPNFWRSRPPGPQWRRKEDAASGGAQQPHTCKACYDKPLIRLTSLRQGARTVIASTQTTDRRWRNQISAFKATAGMGKPSWWSPGSCPKESSPQWSFFSATERNAMRDAKEGSSRGNPLLTTCLASPSVASLSPQARISSCKPQSHFHKEMS